MRGTKLNLSVNKAFYILLTAFTGAFLLLLSLLSKIAPLTLSHTVYFCKESLNGLGFSLPHSFPSLFALLLLLILSIGLLSLFFQIIRTQLFIKKVLNHKVVFPKKLDKLIKQLTIEAKIDVVNSNKYLSFCYGLIKPRICLSSKLVKCLTEAELKALLLHETSHLKNKDPFKILLSQIAISMFFFIPSLKDIHNYYILSKEVSADQMVAKMEGVKNLKSALIKIVNNLTPTVSGVAAFARADDIEQRFSILVNPAIRVKVKISPINILLSGIVFVIAIIFLNLPVHAMEGEDGSHAYFIMSADNPQMVSCVSEDTTIELPFSSQKLFSPLNYSVNH